MLPQPALFSLTAAWHSLNPRIFLVIGEAGDEEVRRKILAVARAAATARDLRRAKVGLVGLPNPVIVDVSFSDRHLWRIVLDILYPDTIELLCVQEADLPCTVLALALNRISSQPIVLGELVHVNPERDVAIFAHGEVLESKYPPPEAVANGPMRFEVPVGQLVEAWAREGPVHHQVLVCASLPTELDALCTLLDVEVVPLKGAQV